MQSGKMRYEIVEALLDAFPDPGDMDIVVSLADIGTRFVIHRTAVGVNYEQALYALIGNYADPQDQLLPLLTAARKRNPGNPKLRALMAKLADLEDRYVSLRPDKSFGEAERIVLKGVTFEDVSAWIEKLKAKRGAVCRVEPQPQAETTNGFGSGFLVAPDVVITNFHVARPFWDDEEKARRVVLRFGYQADAAGSKVSDGVVYRLATAWRGPGTPDAKQAKRPWQVLSSPENELDYALLRLDKPAGTDLVNGVERGVLTLTSWRFSDADPLLILQHPSAAPLKLAIGAVEKPDPPSHVLYKVNTDPGSSGSPCLNQRLETVALHHQGEYSSNRGVTFKAIRENWSNRQLALEAHGLSWLVRHHLTFAEQSPAPPTKVSTGAVVSDFKTSPEMSDLAMPQGARTNLARPNSQAEEIRDVLRPLMGDRETRRARLSRAFKPYTGLLDRIGVDGETGVFLDLLVDTLEAYGQVDAGKSAVCVLLESIKSEVGVADRHRIDAIIRAIQHYEHHRPDTLSSNESSTSNP
jgi:hypothetical protein